VPAPKIIPVDTLGPAIYDSPLKGAIDRFYNGEGIATGCRTKDFAQLKSLDDIEYFELGGPRERIFFDPKETVVGIVTCGGLCPGLNDVIRALTFCSLENYGVKRVLGFPYGYEGLVAKHYHFPVELDTDNTDEIHEKGGTVLRTSRGAQDIDEIIDTLVHYNVNILFTIGGDGTQRGAQAIAEGVKRRNLPVAVVGIPKTIDNDVPFIDRSFGYVSAYSAAVDVIRSARVEAMAARNGIGLVKLMGRHSGFLACHAALASTEADLVLIPEVPIALEGSRGVYAYIDRVLARKGYAVVVVAEGAAQELIADDVAAGARDKSGNAKLKDVGVFLRDRVVAHYKARGDEATVKYIDPSYAIRSIPACASDSVYCWNLARNVVHAAMAGNTKMLIGRWHGRFVHVPMALATRERRHVDTHGDLWMSVIEATGQPRVLAEEARSAEDATDPVAG
jgi:6-phosphofructokinase 1